MIRLFRKNATEEEIAIGADVKFEEFVRDILDRQEKSPNKQVTKVSETQAGQIIEQIDKQLQRIIKQKSNQEFSLLGRVYRRGLESMQFQLLNMYFCLCITHSNCTWFRRNDRVYNPVLLLSDYYLSYYTHRKNDRPP